MLSDHLSCGMQDAAQIVLSAKSTAGELNDVAALCAPPSNAWTLKPNAPYRPAHDDGPIRLMRSPLQNLSLTLAYTYRFISPLLS